MQLAKSLAVLAVLGLAGSAMARPIINFDTDANGNPIPDNTPLSNALYAGFGVSWGIDPFPAGSTSGSGSSADAYMDLGATDTFITSTDTGGYGTLVSGNSTGNILHSFSGWAFDEDGDPVILLQFASPISAISIDFVGIGVSVGWTGFDVYAAGGSTFVQSLAVASAGQVRLSWTGSAAVDTVVIYPGTYDDWVGIDNINFTSVPTPGAMALLGLGGVVAGRRRRA